MIQQESRSVSTPARRRRAAQLTMRACIVTAPTRCELQDVAIPDPKPGEVRVRLDGCCLCASNLPVWEGRPWFQYPCEPGAPGHEAWGIVDTIGGEVKMFTPGDRVGVLSYRAFAEYDVAPADCLVRIPNELDGRPFPAEPLGCAMNVLRRSDIAAGNFVAVVGTGFFGLLLVQLARSRGARVAAVSHRPCALEKARRLGAELCIPADDPGEVYAEIQHWSGEGCDRVIEATGWQEPLDLATKLLRVRGKLIIAGYHQDGLRQVDMRHWNWIGLDVVNAHERDPVLYVDGMRLALKEMSAERLTPWPLYTHRFQLEDINTAFKTAAERPAGFVKALVETG